MNDTVHQTDDAVQQTDTRYDGDAGYDPGYDAGRDVPPSGADLLPDEGGRMRLPRRRGAVTGVLLVLLGGWGALAPFIGPYFHFAFTPKPTETWHWTAARGWYEVLPGGVAVFGGLLLIVSTNRLITSFGAWIAAVAGGWFVVGPQVALILTLGSPGQASARGDRRYVTENLAFFGGLGAVIILFAAIAIGRLSVRSVRDVKAAAARDASPGFADVEPERDAGVGSFGEPVADADDHAPYRRDPADVDRAAVDARDDADRAARDKAVTDRNAAVWAAGEPSSGYGTPHAAEPAADAATTTELPTTELPTTTESATAEPAATQSTTTRLPTAESATTDLPLALEPPAGHPDAPRSSRPSMPETESAPEPAPAVPQPSVDTWNPAAQSPTTTGELPAIPAQGVAPAVVGESAPTTSAPTEHAPTEEIETPSAAATASRANVQQPRRYVPATAQDTQDLPAAPETDVPEAAAPETDGPATQPRDEVRTDEGLGHDLEHDLDFDEPSSRPR